jgi:ketosteroid isomerase-like protein
MSANFDLVRSIYAAHERGDFSSAEWADSEIEFIVADGPLAGRWTGVTGMQEGIHGTLAAWDDARTYADEYREIDDERVLVLTHRTGRGKRSGIELGELRTRGATLLNIRDGKVTKWVTYFDRDRALADLGLEG